ncbi:MAG TPA: DUF1254 domain-containing protein [Oligoflexus sp.]|uniref:DUF1254 domain-containing protein n=1 Tax=Oligoflexus sp. TaxID=1971216 RepID=UPI002D809490|nr:DUF1254 domain-containing protein [Oligoflexus sp.]HET9240108.1 DUF1254 domain-containing protein [Oligoflexus sp.]
MKYIQLGMFLLATCLAPWAEARSPARDAAAEQELRDIATEAYIYVYPLVTMDVTRKVMTNTATDDGLGRGPMNSFHHIRTFPSADMKDVVRPNFDTLYSVAWLDLTQGPLVIDTPDTQGRYYLLPMMDMWTDVFAVPGKRTTGTKAAQYVVVPQGWKGQLPAGAEKIEAPTPYVWIIGRTQTNGVQDFANVNDVQNGFTVRALDSAAQEPTSNVAPDPTVDMATPPLEQVNRMPALDYFRYAAELMKLHKPHITDQSLLFRLEKLGLVPGQSLKVQNALIQKALEAGAADGLKKIESQAGRLGERVNGWQIDRGTMGVYGNDYLKRAYITLAGLGANLPEDAVYPLAFTDAYNEPLTGAKNYVLHFDKDELPPVDAFWSVTMYDVQGFPVPNPLNRYALGDRDPLKYNPDGSLDLYIQHENPGPDKESNWLPAPEGGMGVTMRLYAPRASVLDGSWNPPAIR